MKKTIARIKRLTLGLVVAAVLPCLAQEYRATIVGSVTDPTGAAAANAKVSAINTQTGGIAPAHANAEGNYVIPFLLPGAYTLRVEHPGFKTLERGPIEVSVNDRSRVDIQLEVGQVSEQVTVAAQAPLLEQANADRGQVIDNRNITDLPMDSRNPFNLMNLGTGVQFTGDPASIRPFDNGAIADFAINGGRTGINEYQIDGVSNNANTGRANLAYVPPSEATQEFKVQSSAYDAQYGRTGGGVISVSIKPGTNKLHGAFYEYLRRTAFEANLFANNANNEPRPKRLVDQYGFELDGPVVLPKIYNGRQRTFFMIAVENYRDSKPIPALGAVPTAEQRSGDFTGTVTRTGAMYTVYDPLTNHANPNFNPSRAVSLANLQYIRDPFPGNRVPRERMEPIALRVLQDIPLPNRPGDPVTKLNNWFAGQSVSETDFRNLIGRVDHTITQSWRVYGRWNYNYRDGGRIDYHGWGTPASRKIQASRRNDGAVLDAVGTISPSTVLSARLGFNRFKMSSHYKPFDMAVLGFPKELIGQLQIPDHYPIFTFENYLQCSMAEHNTQPSETYTAQTGITRVAGSHAIKYGGEFRLLHYANFGRANASGTYAFTRGWTSSNGQINDANSGNAIASLLLGVMNNATATLNATPYLSWRYPVLYFQDDWQASRRLTLNIGLRWDQETPAVERYNRQNRGFDFAARTPYNVPGMDLRGGLLFAGVDGQPRGAFNPDRNNFQPRFGVAWRVLRSKPLVFRGGIGRSYLPTTEFGGNTGFAQATTAEVTTTEFGAFRFLSNPFPNGLVQPPGASLGLKAQVGDAVTFSDQRRQVPNVWQFSAGFQYEIFPGNLVEASYVGSRTRQIQVDNNLNHLTPEQLGMGTVYLNQSQPNPFYGVLPANTSRGQQPTISRRNLMMPFPQFTNVNMNNLSLGKSWYNSFQFKYQRRFKQGFTALVSYTNSKTMEAVDYLSASDERLARELVSFDVPQRLVVTGIYELPFGARRKWAKSGWLSRVVGGWQASWVGTFQRGIPMKYPDYYLMGDPRLKSGQDLNHWFDTSSDIWIQRPPDTLRVTPLRSPNIRRHSAPQVNTTLVRNFRMGEKRRFQVKLSAFNISNTPLFNLPNTSPTSPLFGVVSPTQFNMARSIELAFRYAF